VTVAALALSALLDRGLLDYYAYNRNASGATFAQAARLDPTSATAYWGQALALGPNINEALDETNFDAAQPLIARAVAAESSATPRDRDLIDALALRYAGTWQQHASDDAAYRKQMGALEARYPLDDDVVMIYGEALADAGGRYNWAYVASLADMVLARNPQHPMANHLCIHAHEDEEDRTPAIPCAKRLDAMTFSPEQEHLAHMPAHTWIETGAFADAIASSERAYALAERLRANPDADPSVYEGHDVGVGLTAATYLGNEALAMKWAARGAALDAKRDRTSMVLVRFGRWTDILAETDPADSTLAAAKVLAHAHLGDYALARSTYAALSSAQKDSPLGVLAKARLDERDGKINTAARSLRTLAGQQNDDYDAEYLPMIPALEALGGLYLRSGSLDDAVATFGETLKHYPNDPRALYGLATAYQKDGKVPEAAMTLAAYQRQWEGADTTLSPDDL
jgi:tetratricopeptide (TPR) repeat protein